MSPTEKDVGAAEQATLVRLMAAAWSRGWQPAEVVRHVRRTCGAAAAGLAALVIGVDHADRAADTLDPRWVAQLETLDLSPVDPVSGWLADWVECGRTARHDAIAGVTMLELCLTLLVPLPIIVPPPGAQRGFVSTSSAPSNDPMLNRVRALLAQAESTNFEAEAETFTAKAQELMTRHAIDAVALQQGARGSGSRGSEAPITIRIGIDDPYLKAKTVLLACVAKHSRCRTVIHGSLGIASIVGLADDVSATEILFTSLLVQVQTAMRSAAANSRPGAYERKRAFRASFVIAYAYRIGERLAAINAAIIADVETETHQSLMPVLAARSALVDAAVDEMFGKLRPMSSRIGIDGAGWESGRLAADRARLNSGDLPSARRRLDAGVLRD